jgi:hypothetical protein
MSIMKSNSNFLHHNIKFFFKNSNIFQQNLTLIQWNSKIHHHDNIQILNQISNTFKKDDNHQEQIKNSLC